VASVVAELERLLADEAHWEDAADHANRYFATPAEGLPWLRMIRDGLTGEGP
jgi:hypothetical protein